MQQIQTMFKPLKMLSKLFAPKELPEAQPYQFEYDRPIPDFNEYTENLIQHKFSYEPQRCRNTNDLATQTSKRGGRVKGRN